MARTMDFEALRKTCHANRRITNEAALKPCDTIAGYLKPIDIGARAFCPKCKTFGLRVDEHTIRCSKAAR